MNAFLGSGTHASRDTALHIFGIASSLGNAVAAEMLGRTWDANSHPLPQCTSKQKEVMTSRCSKSNSGDVCHDQLHALLAQEI